MSSILRITKGVKWELNRAERETLVVGYTLKELNTVISMAPLTDKDISKYEAPTFKATSVQIALKALVVLMREYRNSQQAV